MGMVRLRSFVHRFAYVTHITRANLFTLVLLLALLWTVTVGVVASGWAANLGQLALMSLAALVLGMLLAKSRFTELTALLMSTVYGLLFTLLLTAAAQLPNLSWPARFAELAARLSVWLNAIAGGEFSQATDPLVFTLFIGILFWYLGHNAAWHTFRLDRLGRVVIPPGIVLLVNNLFYDGPLRLDAFLIVYGMWALLLAADSHLQIRQRTWYHRQLPVAVAVGNPGTPPSTPAPPTMDWFRAGVTLSLLLVIMVAVLPSIDPEALAQFKEQWIDQPLADVESQLADLFAPANQRGTNMPTSPGYFDAKNLALGGPISLGEGDVMYVRLDDPSPGEHRFYWRARAYDSYDGRRWRSDTHTHSQILVPAATVLEAPQFWEQRQVVQRFSWSSSKPTTLVYTAQQPLQVGLPAEVDLIMDEDRPVSVLGMVLDRALRPGDYYDVLSLISKAGPDKLRNDDMVYPGWVTERYLQLPDTVTQRTRDLARRVVDAVGADNPYDQARALESWLRVNIQYNEQSPIPPSDRADFVDWVLFDLQEGYCSYYASSMVIMLRSLGVPARMAGGFSEGTWDDIGQRYTVRESDAHAWVEVFFPRYGWVEFEPTASRPLPSRNAPPTPTPLPTPTPIILTATPQPAGGGVVAGQMIPTATPTLTPTPTVQPAVTVTAPAQERLESGTLSSNGSALLRGILIAVLFVLILVVAIPLAGLALWWWVEVRGLGDLTPASQAYARLHIYGRWLGVRPPHSDTPAERSRRLVNAAPRAAHFITRITDWYILERYRGARPARRAAIQRTWAQTRLALIRQAWQRRLGRLSRLGRRDKR